MLQVRPGVLGETLCVAVAAEDGLTMLALMAHDTLTFPKARGLSSNQYDGQVGGLRGRVPGVTQTSVNFLAQRFRCRKHVIQDMQ